MNEKRVEEGFLLVKLYVFPPAPNPMKVLVYMKEKGIELPLEHVNLIEGESRTPEFLKLNPLGAVPVLELDDGSHLTESGAIIGYLEDLNPDPPMIGTDPLSRARIREVERIADLGVIGSVGAIFQNTSALFAGRVKQSAEVVDAARGRLANALGALDPKVGDKPFAAGDEPTIADCTLWAGLAFAKFAQVDIDPSFGNVLRWFESFGKRPSVQ